MATGRDNQHVLLVIHTSFTVRLTTHDMAQSDEMQIDSEPQEVSSSLNVKDGEFRLGRHART